MINPHLQLSLLLPVDGLLLLHMAFINSINSEIPSMTVLTAFPPWIFTIFACNLLPLKHRNSHKIDIWYSTCLLPPPPTLSAMWAPQIHRSRLFHRTLFVQGLFPCSGCSGYLNTNRINKFKYNWRVKEMSWKFKLRALSPEKYNVGKHSSINKRTNLFVVKIQCN